MCFKQGDTQPCQRGRARQCQRQAGAGQPAAYYGYIDSIVHDGECNGWPGCNPSEIITVSVKYPELFHNRLILLK